MSELKLCKDCKHYQPAQACYMAGIPDACMHPDMLEADPVHGRQVFKAGYFSSRPHYQRKQGACGMDAKRFEQAPPPEPPKLPYSIEITDPPKQEGGGFWDGIASIFR